MNRRNLVAVVFWISAGAAAFYFVLAEEWVGLCWVGIAQLWFMSARRWEALSSDWQEIVTSYQQLVDQRDAVIAELLKRIDSINAIVGKGKNGH